MIEKNEKVGIDIMAIIKKSRSLFPLWSSNLSPYALKLFEVYLSKIDMDNPETKCVVFPKRLLEKIFGVKRIRKGKLDPALKQLMNSTVEIDDKINGKRVKVLLNLMEAASLIATDHPENTSGVQQIKMICSEKAMEYIFNVPKKGFIPYDLEYVISAKRKCDYMLFLYLTFNRFRTKFEVKVEDLKKVLRCDKEETYDDFRYFNDLVLKKAQKALRENCNYRFKYKTIKTGRRVTSILFDLSEAPEKFTHKNKYPSTTTTEQKQQNNEQPNNSQTTYTPPSSLLARGNDEKSVSEPKNDDLDKSVSEPKTEVGKNDDLDKKEKFQPDFDAMRTICGEKPASNSEFNRWNNWRSGQSDKQGFCPNAIRQHPGYKKFTVEQAKLFVNRLQQNLKEENTKSKLEHLYPEELENRQTYYNRREDGDFDDCDEFKEKLRV